MTKKSTFPRKCQGDCGRTIRPNSWKAEDHPDTVCHGGRGLCGTCAHKARILEKGEAAGKHIAPRPSIEENRRSLQAFQTMLANKRNKDQRRQKIRMVTK